MFISTLIKFRDGVNYGFDSDGIKHALSVLGHFDLDNIEHIDIRRISVANKPPKKIKKEKEE